MKVKLSKPQNSLLRQYIECFYTLTTFVNGLKGDLLIVHGTGDDNVHYQSTEYLIDALITANKPFTIMPYPNRTHSISEGEGTTRHLYELLTQYLKERLPVR